MRNVRNFWVNTHVDGYKKETSGGPRDKDGGLSSKYYIRNNGSVCHALDVSCWNTSKGENIIDIQFLRKEGLKVVVQEDGFKIIAMR